MLDLSSLNPNQKQAVETTDGPLLILAGAGSGKTKVLTYRIAYILKTGLAGYENILALTFTNKAANEMKERINKVLEQEQGQEKGTHNTQPITHNLFWMGTFHSICVKILKKYAHLIGYGNSFTIYDSADQLQVVKKSMEKLNISTKEFNPHAIHSYISSAKNELITPEAYEQFAQGYFQSTVAEVYPVYQKTLKDNNAMDFDDLLFYTAKLFDEHKDVLEKFQKQFKYILVDEYQDTNQAQYVLIKKLAEYFRNICCVGDDDQSIYAFRGATIKNILSFEKDYPETKVIKLEQNYRSTKKILEASYSVISKNKSRKDKKLWTENLEGENITLYTAGDEQEEANWIVETIEKIKNESLNPKSEKETKGVMLSTKSESFEQISELVSKHRHIKNEDKSQITSDQRPTTSALSLRDFAVLYRTNAQSRSLEEGFLSNGMPYKVIGGVRFYDRKEIKDTLAYLRVIFNPKDDISLERIINVPKRGIGGTTIKSLQRKASEQDLSLGEYLLSKNENLKMKNEIIQFSDLLEELIEKSKSLDVVQLIDFVLDKTGYSKSLKDGTIENETRLENLKELSSVAGKYSEFAPRDGLESFLEEVSLIENAVQSDEVSDFVTLMTVHAAKGLEFEYVFVAGMEEGIFPHSNSMVDPKELEEERRLAYVAITRAKKKLYLTHASKRRYFGTTQRNIVSRFVGDIDSSILDKLASHYTWSETSDFEETEAPRMVVNFKPGDKVKHEYFGIGVVKYMDGEIIEVDFGNIFGTKELMLEYVRLQKV